VTSFNFEHSEVKDELLRKELVDEVSEESSAYHSSSSFADWIVGVFKANIGVIDHIAHDSNEQGPSRDRQP